MYLVTSLQMKKIDSHTIHQIGIPSIVLMENAGRESAREIVRYSEHVPQQVEQPHWLILAGKGNNGGDGLAIARHLSESGFSVDILFAENPDTLQGEAAVQRDIIVNMAMNIKVYEDAQIDWHTYDGIIDTLLGTGAKGAPREPYAAIIRAANECKKPIVAIDIPSGLHADTGEVYEPCIHADMTVCLAFAKQGLLQYPAAGKTGCLVTVPIGIPVSLAQSFGIQTFLLNPQTFRSKLDVDLDHIAHRNPESHKGTYGHVLVAAGSESMSGAGILSSKASLRAGCGLTTWALPESILQSLMGRVPEVMLRGLADGNQGDWRDVSAQIVLELMRTCHAAVIGPGMGRFPGDRSWIRTIWEESAVPVVFDADALNMIADAADFDSWKRRNNTTILTPHPGEMARLSGLSNEEVQRDRIGLARRFALQHQVTLVLKGARTVIAAPNGHVYVNTTGNPGMATAGAGDVLAGMTAALLAQGYRDEQAAALAVYLHGAAGDRAAAGRQSPSSLLADDIIEQL